MDFVDIIFITLLSLIVFLGVSEQIQDLGDQIEETSNGIPDLKEFNTFYVSVVHTRSNCPVAVEVMLLDTTNDATFLIGQMYIDTLWWMNDTPNPIDGRVFLDLDKSFSH